MILVMIKDICVVLIKFVDCMYNMCMLGLFCFDKRVRIVKEMFEIYSLFVYCLGIIYLKNELEDFCFKVMYLYCYNVLKMVIEIVCGIC